ncbi:Inositol 3-kinase [Vitis vinifera]|uniref:Inositol 3-kinase n=1 Tax=Vitis vinifera TaxID=29760 RepID=A0A438G1Z1_VITVI|nr:Inositol 3-kinase [Vitis vinifera]
MLVEQKQPNMGRRGLVVGNYCHDVLIRNDVVVGETLGGAASFISNVLDGVSIRCDLVSKVGSDFAYSVAHPPIVVPTSPTTLFHAFFDSGSDGEGACDRVLKRVRFCGAIEPSDLPESRFNFGMAVGVAGEILPETLEQMLDICEVVFVDIQALIRVFDSSDGTVRLVGLKGSGFFHLLPRIGFLKASAEEAPYVDVEEARKWCCVLITNGKEGCTLYWKDGEMQISPFPTVQIDPTGAGDSFLGGFVAGLVQGLAVPDAALLGNLFGSMTVGQIGLPKFELRLLQRVKDEVQRRKMQSISCCEDSNDDLKFVKPAGHQQFHSSLAAAKLTSAAPLQECQWDLRNSPPRAIEQGIPSTLDSRSYYLIPSMKNRYSQLKVHSEASAEHDLPFY